MSERRNPGGMDRPRADVWIPRYGTVRTALGFGLLYVVVGHATDAIIETIAVVAPAVSPALLGSAMAGVLWVALAALLGVEYRRQTAAFPSFASTGERHAFLRQHAPTPRRLAVWLALVLVGATVGYVTAPTFFATLDDALLVGRRLAEQGVLGSFSLANLAFGVAFMGGFAAVAYAADRVLVGLARMGLAWEAERG